MSTAVEATGFIMCLISWLVTGAALSNDYWKISTVSGSVIISQRLFENLWHACAENSAGIAECRDFESLLGLPGEYNHTNKCIVYIQMAHGDIMGQVSVTSTKTSWLGHLRSITNLKIITYDV